MVSGTGFKFFHLMNEWDWDGLQSIYSIFKLSVAAYVLVECRRKVGERERWYFGTYNVSICT